MICVNVSQFIKIASFTGDPCLILLLNFVTVFYERGWSRTLPSWIKKIWSSQPLSVRSCFWNEKQHSWKDYTLILKETGRCSLIEADWWVFFRSSCILIAIFPELLPLLSGNSYHHFVLSTGNILTASVVTSAVQSSLKPVRIVSHVITDKKNICSHAFMVCSKSCLQL